MTAFYDELLTLCAFDQGEIEDQRPRIESAFTKLGLAPADMERAVARVQKSFDLGLLGVRKALGVCLKELFDVVLARQEGGHLCQRSDHGNFLSCKRGPHADTPGKNGHRHRRTGQQGDRDR